MPDPNERAEVRAELALALTNARSYAQQAAAERAKAATLAALHGFDLPDEDRRNACSTEYGVRRYGGYVETCASQHVARGTVEQAVQRGEKAQLVKRRVQDWRRAEETG